MRRWESLGVYVGTYHEVVSQLPSAGMIDAWLLCYFQVQRPATRIAGANQLLVVQCGAWNTLPHLKLLALYPTDILGDTTSAMMACATRFTTVRLPAPADAPANTSSTLVPTPAPGRTAAAHMPDHEVQQRTTLRRRKQG